MKFKDFPLILKHPDGRLAEVSDPAAEAVAAKQGYCRVAKGTALEYSRLHQRGVIKEADPAYLEYPKWVDGKIIEAPKRKADL